jgi:hypothetical protein
VESYAVSSAHDSLSLSSTSVFRSHLQSIAEEVIDSASFDTNSRVALLVEGEGSRRVAADAFIEVLQKRNFNPVLFDSASGSQSLQVVLLNTEVKVRELDGTVSERIFQTTLEARTVKGADLKVHVLGTFHRESKDTVQTSKAGVPFVSQKNDEQGILQRMLTPLVVIGGVIVIVYLFFTVRS